MISITGSETTAYVRGLTEEQLDDSARNRIEEIVNHPAFTNDIIVMPDVHVGPVSVVGFTMKVGNRIIPNVIGVDIGCGMAAFKLNSLPMTDTGAIDHEFIEEKIRNTIPMGWGEEGYTAPSRNYYHVKNQYPFEKATNELRVFAEQSDADYTDELLEFVNNGGYDIDYFKNLASDRAGEMATYFDTQTAINAVGTLGSGNHFIEIAQSDETGEYWVVIHSGSRSLGEKTALYHQQRAIEFRDGRADEARNTLRDLTNTYKSEYVNFDLDSVSDNALLDWLQGGKGEGFLNEQAIRDDYLDSDPEQIETIVSEFKQSIPSSSLPNPDKSSAWLEGSEAAQYIIDMVFCQLYAIENRTMMGETIADVLDTTITDEIHSTHNYIDFRDQIIRKGATRAYDGERAIIPFNMRDGSVIVTGKSNEVWNKSVSHGTGREMSRGQAKDLTSPDEVADELRANDVYAGETPADEAPLAYKDASMIETAISDTAAVAEHLTPIHNFKAP